MIRRQMYVGQLEAFDVAARILVEKTYLHINLDSLQRMTRRNLVLIHRGPEYEQDFKEISEKVFAIDPDITIYSLPTGSTDQLPGAAWQRPTLTVALSSNFNLRVKRGPVLKNYQIDKLTQYKTFREADIPTPPMLEFKFGMKLDPLMFGEFVIIKPTDLRLTSKGDNVQLFRRKKLEQMTPQDFSNYHPTHKDRKEYLVQQFVDTGDYPAHYRVQTFFGTVLYAWFQKLKHRRAALNSERFQP